jgi:hypothetical protein
MKTLLTITILLFTISLQAQSSEFLKEYNELRSLPTMKSTDVQFVRLEAIQELRFSGLQDREQFLLLEKIEDAYWRFNGGKKEIDPSTLLAFIESENPVCKWSGLFEEVEEKRLVKVYKVDIKIMLLIFDL